MGTPAARRIAFGTAVTPRITATTTDMEVVREDGSSMGTPDYTDTILDTTINKRFGGKGTATIAADQVIEGWVTNSIAMAEIDGIEDHWDDMNLHWEEVLEITTTDHTIRHDSATCNFLYVKNVGSVEARVFLDGTEPDILLPAGASVAVRLNSVSAGAIKADTAADSTKIEFVVAKE
jgi:hypothetical protein